MKILFLSYGPPHARSLGGQLIVYHRIRRLLERGHQVGLSVLLRNGDERHLSEWRARKIDLRVFPMPEPPTGWRRVRDELIHPMPVPFRAYRSRAMMRGVGDMVEQGGYQIVVAEFSMMGQYLHHNPWLPAVRKIISCHQCIAAESRPIVPETGWHPGALRTWGRRQRQQRCEFKLFKSADRVLVFTREERFALLAHAPALHVHVVPCGVDAHYFKPSGRPATERVVLFTGNYSDSSNRDAVDWFVRRVWPSLKARHPDLVFRVVGPEPPARMTDMAGTDSGIEVTGEVEDVRPYLNEARVYVCPVLKGSGMRMKILEAMAAGVPVVTTTLAAKGIPVHVGENCLVADDPEIMARSIDLLLNDAPLCAAIARRARDMVVDRFAWDHSLLELENIFRDVARAG